MSDDVTPTPPDAEAVARETWESLERLAKAYRGDLQPEQAAVYAHAAACVRFVAALDAGEIVQFSGWGKAADPSKFGIRLRTAGPMDFGFGPDVLTAFRAAQDHTGGKDVG